MSYKRNQRKRNEQRRKRLGMKPGESFKDGVTWNTSKGTTSKGLPKELYRARRRGMAQFGSVLGS